MSEMRTEAPGAQTQREDCDPLQKMRRGIYPQDLTGQAGLQMENKQNREIRKDGESDVRICCGQSVGDEIQGV